MTFSRGCDPTWKSDSGLCDPGHLNPGGPDLTEYYTPTHTSTSHHNWQRQQQPNYSPQHDLLVKMKRERLRLTDGDAPDLHTGRLQSGISVFAVMITSVQTGFVNTEGCTFASRFTFIKSCCTCSGSLCRGPPVPPCVASLLTPAD